MKMIKRIGLGMMIVSLMLVCGATSAEVRTYRQFKDVAAKENGQVSQSENKGDLFEYTYSIDAAANTVTRTKIRRLDEDKAHNDSTLYDITQEKKLLGSEAGNGGDAIVAIQRNGGEILVLSRRFAFTSRLSSFSQVITGVYQRVYFESDESKDHEKKEHGKGYYH